METPHRPFGYWIKEIDRRIEEDFGRLLAAEGLERRGWQVLNTVAAAPVPTATLDERLAPFLDANEPSVRGYVEALAARGWVTPDGDLWTITEEGRRGHERASATIHAARRRIMDGISDDEYRTLMDLLPRVAANLSRL
jgi:DNA-binding MarR family transcriptional regulator